MINFERSFTKELLIYHIFGRVPFVKYIQIFLIGYFVVIEKVLCASIENYPLAKMLYKMSFGLGGIVALSVPYLALCPHSSAGIVYRY